MPKCPHVHRIEELEKAKIGIEKDILSMLEKLSSLTWWVRSLVITLIPCALAAFGYLIVEVFHNVPK